MIRLSKHLSDLGLLSRRSADQAIRMGRITVNGQAAQLGEKIDPTSDTILFDGKAVGSPPKIETILLHKPRFTVCTKKDPEGRPTVMDLVPESLKHLNPVGRLDFESEGLILLTNDGELHHQLTHPKFGISKTYQVKVRGMVDPHLTLELKSRGLEITDDRETFQVQYQEVKLLRHFERRSILEMTLTSGKNRVIRKTWSALGYEVERLKRTSFAGLELGSLPPGKWKTLSPKELRILNSRGCAPSDLPSNLS